MIFINIIKKPFYKLEDLVGKAENTDSKEEV